MSDNPSTTTPSTMIPSDDIVLVGSQALAAAEMDHPECLQRFLSRLEPARLRRLGEIADMVSQAAFTLAGPHPELLTDRQPPALPDWAEHLRAAADLHRRTMRRAPRAGGPVRPPTSRPEPAREVADLAELYPPRRERDEDLLDDDLAFGLARDPDDSDEGDRR